MIEADGARCRGLANSETRLWREKWPSSHYAGAAIFFADEDDAPLYVDADEPRAGEPATLRLVPYYSWANREIGEMRVFQRR